MRTALVVIDIQNDFITGSLAIKDASRIIPTVNKLIDSNYYDMVIYTLDWHPKEHLSFFSNRFKRPFIRTSDYSPSCEMFDDVIYSAKGSDSINEDGIRMTLWPDHCVAGSYGAKIHAEVKIKQKSVMIYKGTRIDSDGYSAFTGHTDRGKTFLQFLKDNAISRLDFCGLALDYCVVQTALDAKGNNFSVRIILDGCEAIHPEKSSSLISDLRKRGVSVLNSATIFGDKNAVNSDPIS